MKIERAAEWRRICFHRISSLTSLFSLPTCGGHGSGQDSEEHAASFPLHILILLIFSWFYGTNRKGRGKIFYVETASVRPSLTQHHQVTRLSYFRDIRRKSSLQEMSYRLSWNVGTCLPNCTASYITRHLT